MFPNLQSLQLDSHAGPQFGPIIMHHLVSALTISMRLAAREPPKMGFTALSLHVSERMHNLMTLDLNLSDPDDQVEQDLCRLLERLRHLRDVILSPTLFFPSIINPLSTMRSLRVLSSQQGRIDWVKAPSDFHAPLEAGSFPSLQSITFGSSLAHARLFFTEPNFPSSSLVSISLHVPLPHHTTPAHLRELLKTLAGSCPNLEHLEFYMTEIDDLRMTVQEARKYSVFTFADISPLHRLRKLKAFSIRYVHPIEIMDDQIESLAASLPYLEEFVLNAYPMFTPEPSLTLRAIIPFARHCPNIRKLALYLRTIGVDLSPYTNAHFDHLAQLCIGYSSVCSSVENISWFLFPILPGGCDVVASVSRYCDEFELVVDPVWWGTETISKREDAIAFWRNVDRTLGLMHWVKEDRERVLGYRIRALEEELRVAHARLEELEPGYQ